MSLLVSLPLSSPVSLLGLFLVALLITTGALLILSGDSRAETGLLSLVFFAVLSDQLYGCGGIAVSYTHLTLPTNREV